MGQSWTKAHDSSKNTFWENYPSIASPIIDTELNRNEVSVDTVDDRVITLDTTKAEQSDLLLAFKNVSLDETTGIITFTKFNNTTATIDTSLEKIATNFRYIDDPTDPHYQYLELTLVDGTKQYVDLRSLLNQFEFDDTATIHFTVSSDGTVTANVIDGSITESKLQPNFLADCRSAKAGAEAAEQDAIAKALVSEGYANGEQNGVPVTSESPYYHNNAKYWEEQAQSIVGSKVDSFNGRDGIVTSQEGDYDQSQIGVPTGASVGQVPIVRSVGGTLKFVMEDMALDDNDFTISTTWVANADTGDYTTYPYKQVITTALYNNNSSPYAIVLAGTPTNYMSSAELEDKAKLCQEISYSTSGITLLAKEPTTNALTLRVRGV